jgi:hypothetical protein
MFNINFIANSNYFRTGVDVKLFKFPVWMTNTFRYWNYWSLSTNKTLEIQLECDWDTLIDVDVELSRKSDHAGISFSLGLFRHWININIHDSRHWNHTTDAWETDVDRNKNMMSLEESEEYINTVISDIVKNPDKAVKLFSKIKYDEHRVAVIARLAKMQYSTLADLVGMTYYNNAVKSSWWVRREHKLPKTK